MPQPSHATLTPTFSADTDSDNDAVTLKGEIEAALFLTAKPLTLAELAELTEAPLEATENALMELLNDYAFREGCSLELDDTDGYILQVKPQYHRIINKLVPMELSAAAVRTLSAIAIKAPLLQSDLIELRGSSAYDHIQELLAHGLVTKKRQGRSYLLNVTSLFHQHFRLKADKNELAFLVEVGS